MSKSSPSFLLGADPELFLADKSGKIISAIGKVGGSKEAPLPVKELGDGFAVQEDNVLVEYNIPAALSAAHFAEYNIMMLKHLNKYFATKYDGAKCVIRASNVMDEAELQDPRAMVFGCEPDFNVWTLDDNPKPEADDWKLRSAGGHVHIGLKMGRTDKITLGRLLDTTLGLWSVINDPDTQRRQLYGKAGAVRLKKYGIEYRTLSNFWLNSTTTMQTVHAYAAKAISKWRNRDLAMIEPKYAPQVIKAINNSDVALAQELIG